MSDPKRPGRPPLDASRVPNPDVHLTLSPKVYDTASELAKQKRESLQDLIRRGLKKLLDDERG